MVFSSITFLFYFLPITIGGYYLLPKSMRNGWLLVMSLVFYSFGEPIYVLIMIASILIDYTNGLFIEKYRSHKIYPKIFLLLSVALNLGLLGFFKYGDFFIHNVNGLFSLNIPLLKVSLPLGISFFTFQTMSYSIDVYRGNTKAQKNIITFGTYVSMFPQLIAGPIVIYKDVERQLMHRQETRHNFWAGVERFVIGLGKKVLLANSIGQLFEEVKAMAPETLTVAMAWLGITAFMLQIYFDFSGYSDMAIGLGKMFGFEFLENFNYPYMAKSISEFWRRWHMSLSKWFRDYLYIPLGGNKKGRGKTLRNIAVVWVLTGFWHGAAWNYLLWGIYFAVILILEKEVLMKYLEPRGSFVRRLYTLPILAFSFVIFALEDLKHMGSYLQLMLFQGPLVDEAVLFYLHRYGLLLLLLFFTATPYPYQMYVKIKAQGPLGKMLSVATLSVMFLLSLAYIVDGAYNPFLYFRF